MLTWTHYDRTNPATWPPVSGEDVLVWCRTVPLGPWWAFITWANRDSSYGDLVDEHGAEWCATPVQYAVEVIWRRLTDNDKPAAVRDADG